MNTEPYFEILPAETARARFQEIFGEISPRSEFVDLSRALGRVVATSIISEIDVPGFDRANVDGFAVQASSVFGADEENPVKLKLTDEELTPGVTPTVEVGLGEATRISTGARIPRGADAVVMLEHVDEVDDDGIEVRRALTPGSHLSFAGSDLARGELVIRARTVLTPRETGLLAALGLAEVEVFKRPRIGVLSTGDEIVAPGEPLELGQIFDSNQRIVLDILAEIGCAPVALGVVADLEGELRTRIKTALDELDGLVLSGGTSKGAGDLTSKVISELCEVVCHGVAVKPGKPLCLAHSKQKPVVVLPGFPTSAVFTFHEFVVPVLRKLAGQPSGQASVRSARVPLRINSARGRTEYVLVHLVEGPEGWTAYPTGKSSGSLTAFSRADGYFEIDRLAEYVEEGDVVLVRLLGQKLEPAALTFVGSHCHGVDELLSLLHEAGTTTQAIYVGSEGGLRAAERGECDVAGLHLVDEAGVYNTPFVGAGLELIRGYKRTQGVLYRGSEEPELSQARLINRNRGSGTRRLVDQLVAEFKAPPPGFELEVRSHNAVAAAIDQGRADWGVGIEGVARLYGLSFRPITQEHYDFVIPKSRRDRRPVLEFIDRLRSPAFRDKLRRFGFDPAPLD